MEAGESSDSPPQSERRRRTESSGGNSDSDLSDGWNIVDHLDVHSADVPSSDGESVEIIDTESSFRDEEEDHVQPDGENNQLLLLSGTPVVPSDQGELSTPAADRPLELPHEEFFHYSFSWFLFFAVSAVLMSDVALMFADSILDWNVGVSKYGNQPSFLTDLPVTIKPPRQDKEELTVKSVETKSGDWIENVVDSTKEHLDSNKYNKGFYENHPKSPLKIDNHEAGKYFRDLSEVTVSKEAQNKFSQTLLILDALQIGLNDLEDVVLESSELHRVLKSQKETLVNTMDEIRSGVSRSMERVATNVLEKVQRLERSFEIQWCRLDKAGHKDELKGLFYDCQEDEERYNSHDQRKDFDEKRVKKEKFMKDSYRYEVDRDSTGKEYNRHENRKENDVYRDFVQNDRYAKRNYDSENKNKKVAQSKSSDPLDSQGDTKSVNFDGTYGYKFRGNEYEHADKQINQDRNDFNKENFETKNNQKCAKHENSGDYYNTNSDKDNLERNRKHGKDEFKVSESKDFKRGDQTKSFENQRFEDKKSKHEKSEYFEHTKPKRQHFGNDKNVGKFEHVTPGSKPLDEAKNSKEVKFDNLKPFKNQGEKSSKNFYNEENKFSEKYLEATNLQKEHNKYPTSDGSTYIKNDHSKNQESNNFIKSAAEKLSKYLKEKCDKNRQKTTELYNKVKEGVKDKMKVPLEIFNSMFNKYCSTNKNDKKKDEYKEQLKGEYKRNSRDRTMYINEESSTYQNNKNIKNNVVDLKLADSTKQNGSPFLADHSAKLSQWTFVHESHSPNNESNLEGDWFFKVGQSRSKARWSQHRSDWLFERASHRRGGAHSSPHNWLAGRRKNWFFRRAWAREQCRETPDSFWCRPSQDETVTIPGSANFS